VIGRKARVAKTFHATGRHLSRELSVAMTAIEGASLFHYLEPIRALQDREPPADSS
jgi:hypothetical protein